MKNKPLFFTSLILLLAIFLGVLSFLSWYLGVLKKEAQPSQIISDLKKQIEFVQNYSFADLNKYLQNLPTEVLVLPTLKPEEIGRPSLF